LGNEPLDALWRYLRLNQSGTAANEADDASARSLLHLPGFGLDERLSLLL
jgi:hypothetical protein